MTDINGNSKKHSQSKINGVPLLVQIKSKFKGTLPLISGKYRVGQKNDTEIRYGSPCPQFN